MQISLQDVNIECDVLVKAEQQETICYNRTFHEINPFKTKFLLNNI
jgi:hypothetical protein